MLILPLKLLPKEFAIFIIVVKRTFWSDTSCECRINSVGSWKGLAEEKQREREREKADA